MESDGIIYNIYSMLKYSDRPLSVNEIASRAGVDWHTADKKLLNLLLENAVFHKRISNHKFFWTKPF